MGYGMHRDPFFVEKWLRDKTGYKNEKAEKTPPHVAKRDKKGGCESTRPGAWLSLCRMNF